MPGSRGAARARASADRPLATSRDRRAAARRRRADGDNGSRPGRRQEGPTTTTAPPGNDDAENAAQLGDAIGVLAEWSRSRSRSRTERGAGAGRGGALCPARCRGLGQAEICGKFVWRDFYASYLWFRLFSIYGTSGNKEMPRICVPTANPPRWSTKQHCHGSCSLLGMSPL